MTKFYVLRNKKCSRGTRECVGSKVTKETQAFKLNTLGNKTKRNYADWWMIMNKQNERKSTRGQHLLCIIEALKGTKNMKQRKIKVLNIQSKLIMNKIRRFSPIGKSVTLKKKNKRTMNEWYVKRRMEYVETIVSKTRTEKRKSKKNNGIKLRRKPKWKKKRTCG